MAATSSRVVGHSKHPFENSKDLLVVLPNDAIDVEEEARLYDELRAATQFDDDDENYLQVLKRRETHISVNPTSRRSSLRSTERTTDSPGLGKRNVSPSIISNDIWLGDNSGASTLFAREVEIRGWTSVGDKLGGAYIVYECVVRTKEGTVIHAHKRYNAFEELFIALHRTLPHRIIPLLPPKASLAKYRSTFLEKRRRMLQHWLSCVLLHPDLGGCQAVRSWLLE